MAAGRKEDGFLKCGVSDLGAPSHPGALPAFHGPPRRIDGTTLLILEPGPAPQIEQRFAFLGANELLVWCPQVLPRQAGSALACRPMQPTLHSAPISFFSGLALVNRPLFALIKHQQVLTASSHRLRLHPLLRRAPGPSVVTHRPRLATSSPPTIVSAHVGGNT